MSEQNGKQAEVVKRPTNEDKWEWIDYWEQQGQKWREEPEISVERQIYLAKLCRTPQDYVLDIYPFEGVVLTRADVEWLLAIYEDDRGEANSGDVSRVLGSKPEMLILRGADLRHVNLRDLPLSALILGAHA